MTDAYVHIYMPNARVESHPHRCMAEMEGLDDYWEVEKSDLGAEAVLQRRRRRKSGMCAWRVV